jgi:aspartate racemase
MVPSAFVVLDALPLTTNGKVDRRALVAQCSPRPESAARYEAPRTALEQELASLWAEVLGRERVGIHDNFFELGGQSLLIVRLFGRIEKRFGLQIPLIVIFQRPTVEQLATFIQSDREANGLVNEVGKTSDSRPCLFCLSDGPTLARYLTPDTLLYALPLEEADLGPYARIEDLAADLVKTVRRVRPEGPYYLVGHCYRGTVAIEVARRLEEGGQAVAFLGLLNCAPFDLPRLETRSPWLGRLRFHLSALVKMNPVRGLGYLAGRVRTVFRLIQWRLFPDTRHGDRFHWGKRLFRSIGSYRPSHFPDYVALFFAAEYPKEYLEVVRAIWERQGIPDLEWLLVPGYYGGISQEPHVQVLAEQLRRCLQKAWRRNATKNSTAGVGTPGPAAPAP